MIFDPSELSSLVLLVAIGLASGVINTLAGGGSNLTLPVLMMLGLPADVANGTNRVAIVLQCVVGVAGFDRHNSLDRGALVPILIPSLLGGAIGAMAAALLPNVFLKPILLLTILAMSALIVLRPAVVAPPPGTPVVSVRDSSRGWWSLFGAGVFGGFVQAGVGFILLLALAGALRYDLKRANALKMACTLSFTALALVVFAALGKVAWIPGLIIAVGSMLGAHLAVKFAIRASQATIKWFLFAMTLVAVGGALVS